jgi:acyl carrier protein
MARKGGTEGKYLCGYIVAQEDIDIQGLKNQMLTQLPGYMVPQFFVRLEALPLTSNGKVDWRALPGPDFSTAQTGYAAPENETEKKLAEIWLEVLGLHRPVGIDDNFFELGGHSLKATIVMAKVQNVFNVHLVLSELFRCPTVRQLSQCIKEAAGDRYKSLESVEKREYYPLSSPQKRLYILQQSRQTSVIYHISSAMVLEGQPDIEGMAAAFRRLIRRHESFRTSFEMVQGEPVQMVHHEVVFEIGYYDFQVTDAGDRYRWKEAPFGQINALGEDLATEDTEGTEKKPSDPKSQELRAKSCIYSFIRPFDLGKAPLLRVGLMELEENQYILMVDMHHIISDGTSVGIFIKDFMDIYTGEQLPHLRVHYKDVVEWKNNREQEKRIKNQEQYWLKQFKKEIPWLQLPYDYPRPITQSYEGNTLEFHLDIEVTRALKQLAHEEEATVFMVLLALYNVLLGKLSWSEDIVVGIPTAGRNHVELHHIIGMFVNTLALRNYPGGEKTFKAFLKEVKYTALAAFENQDYPFEDLVGKVATGRDPSRSPLFDTMFTLQNIDIPEAEIPGLKLTPYDYKLPVSLFDMTWSGVEKEETLWFSVEYCTRLFKEQKVRNFVDYFKTTIDIVLEDRGTRLDDIDISPGLTDLEETNYEEEAAGDFGF